MSIQNEYPINAAAGGSSARAPARKGGGMVGGMSPFANMMAQEHEAKATGLQLGAQSALTTTDKGVNGGRGMDAGKVPTPNGRSGNAAPAGAAGTVALAGMGGMAGQGMGAAGHLMAAGLAGGPAAQALQGAHGNSLRGGNAQEQALAALVQHGSAEKAFGAAQGAPQDRGDVARAQNYAQARMDMQRTNALDTLAQGMSKGDGLLDSARNAVTMRNLRSVVGGFNLKAPVMPMADSIKSQALQGSYRGGSAGGGRSRRHGAGEPTAGMGKLAAQFESGSDGIAAIGYDRHGGTSYGKYQVASRVGSMDNFMNFLDTAAPDIAKTLRAAGPANTGSCNGAMPTAWRKIAKEQPDRFEALQEKFIYDSHYKPALEAVARNTPLQEDKISSAMQEVLWSTAVQHGPTGAARIFDRAAEQTGKAQGAAYEKKLISSVYDIRAEQFGSSTPSVQGAVRNRLIKEKNLALNMVNNKKHSQA